MIFPVLETEQKLQVKDKTRLVGSKTYVSKGTTALTTLTVKPGADQTPVSVFATNSDNWYLDWQWQDYSFDVDNTCDKIDFNEGLSDMVATLAAGTYTESTLMTAIKTALEVASTETFTVTINQNKIVNIQSTGLFKLLGETGANGVVSILPHLGFTIDTQLISSAYGLPVEYGLKAVTLTAGNGVDTSQSVTENVKVYSEIGDRLFCSDQDLETHEHDMRKWVKAGKSSHKNFIRRSQELILEFLAGKGYVNVDHEKLTKFDMVDSKDLRDWSIYMTLRLVMQDLTNAVDDVFDKKSKMYEAKEVEARNRYIRTDLDKDGKAHEDEYLRNSTGNLFLR